MILLPGDNLETIAGVADASVDACVTDPPYGLTFMGKHWDKGVPVDIWAHLFRVLKPGAHLVAFGGTRTYHHLAVAIEDSGFEIRDQLAWVYGTGFPKSHDISKVIDRELGAVRTEIIGDNPDHRAVSGVNYQGVYAGGNTGAAKLTAPVSDQTRQWQGWGTALKPAWEPIVLARKPLSSATVARNVMTHRTGGLNIDGCRVVAPTGDKSLIRNEFTSKTSSLFGKQKRIATGKTTGTDAGRHPANLIHDGSPEVMDLFPDRVGFSSGGRREGLSANGDIFPAHNKRPVVYHPNSGSAARFFYSAKASVADRNGSRHPTIKPVALMRWLARLVTPPGGTLIDPFAGSGTTGAAALAEGFDAILCEQESEYVLDIIRRLPDVSVD